MWGEIDNSLIFTLAEDSDFNGKSPTIIMNKGVVVFEMLLKNNEVAEHRTIGPSLIMPDGSLFYKINGELHRTTGPAVFMPSGYRCYYVHGTQISSIEYFARYGVV